MVFTLTCNPSIDYLVFIDNLESGKLNRSHKDAYYLGGKGVNVSQILIELGVANTALGFVAGFTGAEIENGLRRIGCLTDFVHLSEGYSRINIKLSSSNETEINASGPLIDALSMKALLDTLQKIGPDDILVLAGSLGAQMTSDSFAKIIASLPYRDTKVIIDTNGESLVNSLGYHPFLIKPNLSELSEILHEDFSPSNPERIIEGAKNLQMKGARNVIVSMGADGAILVCENGSILKREAPYGVVINTVGAGDSLVAGFIAGYLSSGNMDEAFKMGISAGSATAFSSGLAGRDDIMQIYHLMY